MYDYVLKIDLDIKLTKSEIKSFEQTRKAIADSLRITIKSFVMHESSKRGHHAFIHISSYDCLIPETLNFYQFLMGDDQTRYKINKDRLEKGIPWDLANVLFSRVIERRSYDKRKTDGDGSD